ncbi:MAG TPA: slipin family protein [Chthoniobacterales bacterium]|nr:slipin family protein [Chthoniobacterales bacterium]
MTNEYLFIIFLAIAGALAVKIVRARYRHEFIASDGFAGLLYHEGKLSGTLAAGRRVRWGKHYRVTLVEVRKTLLNVAGQEVLTADNVGVKLSVVLTMQIVDAAKSALTADNYATHIYSAAQTAIRAIIAGVTMEALLTQRVGIGAQLSERIAPQAEAVGVKIDAAEVRDVMLPGDLRKAFSEVLKAKQEGQAALERARGETAALRNLANAARLVDNQPGLATLRFLQTLGDAGSKQMVVMNDMSAFTPAIKARGNPRAAPESEEA